MAKKHFMRALICLALLALIGVSAVALRSKSEFLIINNGKFAIATHPPQFITPELEDPTLTTIAGNLSKYPFGTFFCCYGVTIAEGGTNYPYQTWTAIAFTPTANATVTKIKAAVGTFGGTSGFELSINNDSSGVPGTAIKTFHFKNPPIYGACCTLDVGHDNAGIQVTAGTQYWIVASTTSKDVDFLGGWAFNSTDMRIYPAASWCEGAQQYCGSTSGVWVPYSGLLPGFAVLGN